MHRPCDEGADEDAEHGIASDRVHQESYTGYILRRRQRVQENMQREQHQAETDRDPADVLDPGPSAAAEGDQTQNEQDRGGGGDVERQNLDYLLGPGFWARDD